MVGRIPRLPTNWFVTDAKREAPLKEAISRLLHLPKQRKIV